MITPFVLVLLTLAGTGLVVAGTGHARILRPPAPSPAVVRTAAAGSLAAGVALAGTGTAAADDVTPWSVRRPPPTATAPEASARPGPDNPQALPDGSVSIDPVPEAPVPWSATRVVQRGRVVVVNVHRGDTLTRIAGANCTSVVQIARANRTAHPTLASNPDLIRPGWRLTVKGCHR
jgi:nucleoid-associated protein YgaU